MADFKESLEKIKAQLEPILESVRESFHSEFLPFLQDSKQQLRVRLKAIWQNSTRKQKMMAGAGVLGVLLFISGMLHLYWHSEFYARRRLTEMHYELTASGFANACKQMDLVALHYFMQAKWPVDSKDEKGLSTLMSASDRGQANCVHELLVRGADPNLKDDREETAVLFAIRAGSLETVKELINAKANLNYFSKYKKATPLVAAIAKGNNQLVQALLDAGADPNLQDSGHQTALFHKVHLEDTTALSLLLGKRADPNVVDVDGMTPLTNAIAHHNRAAVLALLKAGAKPDLFGQETSAPLHVAIDENLPQSFSR